MIEKPSCPTATIRGRALTEIHGVRFMKRVSKTKDFAEYRCGECGYLVKVIFE